MQSTKLRRQQSADRVTPILDSMRIVQEHALALHNVRTHRIDLRPEKHHCDQERRCRGCGKKRTNSPHVDVVCDCGAVGDDRVYGTHWRDVFTSNGQDDRQVELCAPEAPSTSPKKLRTASMIVARDAVNAKPGRGVCVDLLAFCRVNSHSVFTGSFSAEPRRTF